MKTFYDSIVVNGYDNSGGLWFSEKFTGSQDALIYVLQKAYSVEKGAYITLSLGKPNVTFYDQEGYEIPKSL